MTEDFVENDLENSIIQVVDEQKPETIKQLLDYLMDNSNLSYNEILDSILSLQKEGKIRLRNRNYTSLKFSHYLATSRAFWYWVTVSSAIISVFVFLAIGEEFYPWIYIRNILGVIYVLWLPGYSFIKSLFPASKLTNTERVSLSVCMSLALVAIIGLILNFSIWGIHLIPISLSLLSIILPTATIGVIREYQNKKSLME